MRRVLGQAEVFALAGRNSDAAAAIRDAMVMHRRKGSLIEEARVSALFDDLGT